ncbi:MAG: zinc-dependent metalloprotease [Acidimicrobiales bacterium]
MSFPPPFGGNDPFGGGNNPMEHLLGDLLKLMSTKDPVQWDLARQLAHSVSTDGQEETNVDPLERIRLEELARVADLHVSDVTGLSTSTTGGLLSVAALSRSEWAARALDAWRPLLELLASSLSRPPQGDGAALANLAELGGTGFAELMGSLSQVMGPTLLGLQVGSALGHLARRAMGNYVLPIPWPSSDVLALVPSNITSFAADWSLPPDDVRLWVCLSELAHHAVLGTPHLRVRMEELLSAYVGGFRPNTTALDEMLAGLDPTDPSSIQAAMGDPSALLGERATPEQRVAADQLEAIVLAIEGYVDHIMDQVGARLIQTYPSLTEALRRQRVDGDAGEAMVGQMLGLELSQASYDRGAAFVRGVVERAGPASLAHLWEQASNLPTPAEIGAPGLWLARISLPGEPEPAPGETEPEPGSHTEGPQSES